MVHVLGTMSQNYTWRKRSRNLTSKSRISDPEICYYRENFLKVTLYEGHIMVNFENNKAKLIVPNNRSCKSQVNPYPPDRPQGLIFILFGPL